MILLLYLCCMMYQTDSGCYVKYYVCSLSVPIWMLVIYLLANWNLKKMTLTIGTHLLEEPDNWDHLNSQWAHVKKRNTWTARPKWPWPKNKKATMLGLAHEANKNWQKKYTKLVELMGSAHINTQLDRVDSNFWHF